MLLQFSDGIKDQRSLTDKVLVMGTLVLDYLLPKMIFEYVERFNEPTDNGYLKMCDKSIFWTRP